MLALPLMVLFLLITIWGWFSPSAAAWVFLGLSAVFQGWLLLANRSLRELHGPCSEPFFLSADEVVTFRKYPYYFLSPMIARQWSSVCSWLYALGVLWAALLAWHHLWVFAGTAAALGLMASNLARMLNAGNFLRFHHGRGKLTPELQILLQGVEAVEVRISKARAARSKIENPAE